MAHLATLLFVSAGLLLTGGCNSTGLQGGAAKKGDGKDQSAEQDTGSGKSLGNEGIIVDDEEDAADKPVPVSGVYLTCASVQLPEAEVAFNRFGCVLEKNKVKINRSEFDADYAVQTATGTVFPSAVIEPADAISLWHVFVKVPAGTKEPLSLKAVVRWKTGASSVAETLTAELFTNGKLNALRFGMSTEFHLGNGTIQNSECRERVGTVNLTGTSLTIKFTVAVDATKTAFHVNGICGLNVDGAAQVRVLKGTTIIKTVKLMKSDVDIVFGIGSLNAGEYILVLESLKLPDGDFDDFVIGDITVVSDKLITGELPPSQ